MNNLIFFLLLILAILIEGTISSIPIVLSLLLVFYIFKKKSWLFIPAFIAGIILDVFEVRTIAASSLFFIFFIFGVMLYQRKFEIVTYPFVFISSFLGSLIYLWLFGYDNIFLQSFINSLFAVLVFRLCHPELVSGSRFNRDAEMDSTSSPF